MKRRDLERELAKRGWKLLREGGRHTIWARGEQTIAVPRHKEINEYTARQIFGTRSSSVVRCIHKRNQDAVMRLIGHISKQGRYWAADVPTVGIHTQGTSYKDAKAMIADAIEALVDQKKFTVHVDDLETGTVGITASDPAAFAAFVLRALRTASGLSLADVAKRLGSKSRTVYARYESGRSTPSIDKFAELVAAVAPNVNVTVG